MKAPELLNKAANIMIERGKQYDKPEGERSMGAAVKAFNAITGKDLTEPEGWLLLQVLKDVRQWQNPDRYHADSVEDCIAYAALKGEALAGGVKLGFADKVIAPTRAYMFTRRPNGPPFRNPHPRTPELGPDISFDSEHRMDQIGTNGNEGEHYKEVIDDKPSWDDAPEWATHKLTTGPEWDGSNHIKGRVDFARLEDGKYMDDETGSYDIGGTSWIVLEPRPTKESSK